MSYFPLKSKNQKWRPSLAAENQMRERLNAFAPPSAGRAYSGEEVSAEYNGYFKIVDASETTTNEDGTTNTVFKIAVVDGADSESSVAGAMHIKDFNTRNVSMDKWVSDDLTKATQGKRYLHIYLRYFYSDNTLSIVTFSHTSQWHTGPQDTFGACYVYLGYVLFEKTGETYSLNIVQQYKSGYSTIDRTIVDSYNGFFKIVDTSQRSVNTVNFSESIDFSFAVVDGATYDREQGTCNAMPCYVNNKGFDIEKWSVSLDKDTTTVNVSLCFYKPKNANVEMRNKVALIQRDRYGAGWPEQTVIKDIGRVFLRKVNGVTQMVIQQDFFSGDARLEWWEYCGQDSETTQQPDEDAGWK